MAPSRRLVSFLLLLGVVGGCRCNGNLRHVSASLLANPASLDFGSQGMGNTLTKTFTLTNVGTVPVNVMGVTITGDAHSAFTASLSAQQLGGGQQMTVTVNYTPPTVETDAATAVVASDSGEVDVPLTGTGNNLCAHVSCDAGGQGAVAACAGTCNNGTCGYPTGPCTDPSGCVTNGTCDGMGHCAGACYGNQPNAPCCITPPGPTCSDANHLTITPSPGTCDGTGNCRYNPPMVITCECGCTGAAGQASCLSNWKLVQGAPAGSYASVWAAPAGDLWVSVINGTAPQVNPQTVYHFNGSSWQPVGTSPTVAEAQNPYCSGSGCGMLLTGDSNGTIYGAADCTDGSCSAGGVWRDQGGTVTDDFFYPATLMCGAGSAGDTPVTQVAAIGARAFALDSEPCGPQLRVADGGSWSIEHFFNKNCQGAAALWIGSDTDFFMALACGPSPAIWHWNGTIGSADTQAFALPGGEFVNGIFGSSLNDVWAVGTHRWHCTSNCGTAGATWAMDPSNPIGPDQTIWGTPTGTDYWVGGTYLNIFHYDTATNGPWTEECVDNGTNPAPNVYSIWGDGNGNVYAATSIGLMKRQ